MLAPATNLETPARPHVRTREPGFTVVEIVVACVIMLVLMAGAVVAFRGARSAVYGKETIAAATAYNNAIAKYAADHANTPPTAAQMIRPRSAQSPGPQSLLDPARPYLTSLPDPVQGGRVRVFMQGGSCATGATTAALAAPLKGSITYCPAPAPPGYGIRVAYETKQGQPWKVCWMGNTPNQPACSR